ncbi:MAG TPA: hypothetical protein PLI60_10770, partial [Anaerolineaceae bacterium]|nr:hypothetical protein [Anaerolineaceae bacterium]
MSGIFGVVQGNRSPVESILEEMGAAMSLKPWYRKQHGTVGAGVGLGQVNIGKFCCQPQPV